MDIVTLAAARKGSGGGASKEYVDEKVAALIDDTTAAQNKTYSSAKVEEKVAGEEITTTATGTDLTLSTSAGNINALTIFGKSEVVDGSIKSAGDSGSIEIETCKKNLFDPTKLVIGNITYTDGELSGTAGSFYTAFSTGIPVLFNKTRQITFSVKAYTSSSYNIGRGLSINFVYADNTLDTINILNNTTTPQFFTLTSNPAKQMQYISILYGDGGTNMWHLSEIQLEYGSSATAFEPYNGTMAVFETGTPLYGVSESIRDVMEWDGSAGTVTKKCDSIDLTALTWEQSGNLVRATFNYGQIDGANCISELYTPYTNWASFLSATTPSIFIGENYIFVANSSNPQGKVIYEIATITTTPLTTAENASIAGLRTFTPQTHAQNNAGATMTVEAYAGTANGRAIADLKNELQITQSDTLMLTTAGWSNNAQTVTYTHDTAKRNVIDVDPSSVEEWASCGILATAETATTITFSCKMVPENALNFRVTSMGVN